MQRKVLRVSLPDLARSEGTFPTRRRSKMSSASMNTLRVPCQLLLRDVISQALERDCPYDEVLLVYVSRGGGNVRRKQVLDKLSIYIPAKKLAERPVERLVAPGEKRDRSVNYLVVEAILQYLDNEENA